MKNFVQEGDVIAFTNGGTARSSGDVVVYGKTLGIATGDVAANAAGQLRLSGVFTCPKVSAAVIAAGENVIWDASAGAFDDNAATPATGDVSNCAVAMEAGINGQTTIKVRLAGLIGTVA